MTTSRPGTLPPRPPVRGGSSASNPCRVPLAERSCWTKRDAPRELSTLSSEWTSEACAIPRCPHQAVAALRLLIDGHDVVLPMCQRHAHWLDAYVEEDAKVRLMGRLPKATQEPVTEDGATDQV